MNYLYYSDELKYPENNSDFSPSESYPEYPFKKYVSSEKNYVYEAIRLMFKNLNLDIDNFGSPDWNPLGKWIKPGQRVVLKPNFVMHKNGSANPDDLDSLVTHPSIIRCILDYCYIALKGKGTIIVGDAPVKDCDFKLLMQLGNYDTIEKFYKKNTKSFKVNFLDFRGPEEEGGQYKSSGKGITVNLGSKSLFFDDKEKNKKYRIPNYNYKKVVAHHSGEIQEYMINSEVLEADVIINLPKPKTHRKNGYTGALKNFVGINYSKEYLPHHTEGDIKSGGDEYNTFSVFKYISSKLRLYIDINRTIINNGEKSNNFRFRKKLHRYMWKLYIFCLKLDKYLLRILNQPCENYVIEGTWYKNDTLWRTVLDLNYIINYAKLNGSLSDLKQRTIIHIGDMIISGEGEGPMSPEPKKQNMLLFSDNAVEFDCILTKIMGFDYKSFKGLINAIDSEVLFNKKYSEITVQSNYIDWNKMLSSINFLGTVTSFIPAKGWRGHVEIKDGNL